MVYRCAYDGKKRTAHAPSQGACGRCKHEKSTELENTVGSEIACNTKKERGLKKRVIDNEFLNKSIAQAACPKRIPLRDTKLVMRGHIAKQRASTSKCRHHRHRIKLKPRHSKRLQIVSLPSIRTLRA